MDIEELLSQNKMCDDCHINPANVHLTHVENNETDTYHLCEECARKRGVPFPDSDTLIQGLQALAGAAGASFGDAKVKVTLKPVKAIARPEPEPVRDIVCRGCGLAFSDFRASGLLGCAECYDSFDEHIEKILLQVHGADGHKGKKYGSASLRKDSGKSLELLRKELDRAIKKEEFELAARLRDVIKNARQEA